MSLSLSKLYLRRMLSQGKLYIIIGLAIPLGFTLGQLIINPNTISLNGVLSAYPMIMPITGIWGIIPLVTFLASDRRSGFFEHLFATTEINAEKVYFSLSVVAIIITTIPVVTLMSVSLIFFGTGTTLPSNYTSMLLAYSLPISYIVPLVVLVVASTWSFTTVAIRGPLTSTPAGIVPVVGLLIVLVPIFVQNHLGSFSLVEFLEIYTGSTFVLVAILFFISTRILSPERFLA